jgi:hypothetical protein
MGALGADLALKDDCEIRRGTASGTPNGWDNSDADDDTNPADLPLIATVKCMKTVPAPALLQAVADRLSTLTIWHVAMPLDAPVQEGDYLIIKGEPLKVEVKTQGSFDVLTNVLVSEVS